MKSNQNPDDELVQFVDRVLDGKPTGIDLSADDELRGLQEVVVRLDRAFPRETLDQKIVKRMQGELRSAARKSGTLPGSAWQSRQSRQRMILAVAALALFAAVCYVTPLLSPGGDLQGTAGLQAQSLAILIALGGVIALLIWLGRRR
jgi:hypothetical protein